MLKLIFFAMALATVSICSAQDLIYTNYNETIEAKVAQINDHFIYYKKYENPGGPTYEISKKKVDSIIYENGTKDIFALSQEWKQTNFTKEDGLAARYSDKRRKLVEEKNFLSGGYGYVLNPDYFYWDKSGFHSVYINYQRLLWKNRLGLGANAFLGLNEKAYGINANALYFLKRRGIYRIGWGFEFTCARMRTSYSRLYQDAGYFQEVVDMSTITSFGMNIYQSLDITNNVTLTGEIIQAGITGNSLYNKHSGMNDNFSYSTNGDVMLTFRVGVGYRL